MRWLFTKGELQPFDSAHTCTQKHTHLGPLTKNIYSGWLYFFISLRFYPNTQQGFFSWKDEMQPFLNSSEMFLGNCNLFQDIWKTSHTGDWPSMKLLFPSLQSLSHRHCQKPFRILSGANHLNAVLSWCWMDLGSFGGSHTVSRFN